MPHTQLEMQEITAQPEYQLHIIAYRGKQEEFRGQSCSQCIHIWKAERRKVPHMSGVDIDLCIIPFGNRWTKYTKWAEIISMLFKQVLEGKSDQSLLALLEQVDTALETAFANGILQTHNTMNAVMIPIISGDVKNRYARSTLIQISRGAFLGASSLPSSWMQIQNGTLTKRMRPNWLGLLTLVRTLAKVMDVINDVPIAPKSEAHHV